MATLSFHLTQNLQETFDHTDILLIAGSKNAFQALTPTHPVSQAIHLTAASDIELIHAMASTLKPSGDDSSTKEGFLIPNRRVVVAALPTNCSRHNSPARPHSVSSIVKSNKGSDNLTVVLLPSHRDHAFSQAIAVARQFPQFSMKSKASSKISVNVIIYLDETNTELDSSLLNDIKSVAENIRLCQRLIDTPPNILHTDAYVEIAKDIAKELGCGIEVIQGPELDARGFGGIANVGRASSHPPAIVVLSHVPTGTESKKSLCLVGKGIVYDTGGLSIKTPTTSMAGMKVDMGGSSAVLGAFVAAVQRNVQRRIHAILCIAENSIGPDATRPDDVHTFLSGKTVEVNNTDAEGRLVLADGCFYAASKFDPAAILDMATLTGAQGITTGKNHGAIYCNDEELEQLALKVGKYSGDLTFPLLYCPEFHRAEFRSQVIHSYFKSCDC